MCKNCEEKKLNRVITISITQKGQDNQVIETNSSVYIKMGKYTYYFDNSLGDCSIERWLTDSKEVYSEKPTQWKHIMEMTTDEWLESNLQK
jgi:hypothetical protein